MRTAKRRVDLRGPEHPRIALQMRPVFAEEVGKAARERPSGSPYAQIRQRRRGFVNCVLCHVRSVLPPRHRVQTHDAGLCWRALAQHVCHGSVPEWHVSDVAMRISTRFTDPPAILTLAETGDNQSASDTLPDVGACPNGDAFTPRASNGCHVDAVTRALTVQCVLAPVMVRPLRVGATTAQWGYLIRRPISGTAKASVVRRKLDDAMRRPAATGSRSAALPRRTTALKPPPPCP